MADDIEVMAKLAVAVKAFRAKYTINAGWGLISECLDDDDTMISRVIDPQGKIVAEGKAYVDETQTRRINEIENLSMLRALTTADCVLD